MKCPHCHATVWCQACGRDVVSAQAAWHRRRVALGRCPRCNREKTKQDGKGVNCRSCRMKSAERMRVRYAKRGRKDRRAA